MFSHSCGKYYMYNNPMTGLSQWLKRQTSQKTIAACRRLADRGPSQGMPPKVSANLQPQSRWWSDVGSGK